MATSSKPVGYECEFTDQLQVPEDYFCKQCKHVAREPNITSCCGEVLCKGCVDLILQDKELCPSCDSIEIKPLGLHVIYQQKILALEVHCAMKGHGCQWTGQLQYLNAHLQVTNGDCQYVDVDCPKQCGQKVQKHNVDTHLADHCPNRDYVCHHCNFRDTFQVVSEHFEFCPYYPLACSNRCGVSFERGDLEDHMRMCRLEEVQCVFSNAGCEAKFIRDNEDEHMEQNTQKHLALMAATTLRISQNFERKLQEQEQDFQHNLEVLKKKLEYYKDEQIKAVQDLERKIQQQQEVLEGKLQKQQQDFQYKQDEAEKKLQDKDEQIKAVQKQLQTTSQTLKQQQEDAISQIPREFVVPPYDFTLSNYQQSKASSGYGGSPAMYTHLNGYKFELSIYPTGLSSDDGINVSVFVFSVKSDHDAELQFPVQFTITLQLLNQHRDQEHYTREIQCVIEWRWTIGTLISIGVDKAFIPQAGLEWNADKQTQYLKDDCLRFRITKIVMQ